MTRRVRMWLWMAGAPVRSAEVAAIRLYQLTLGAITGGRCRFYPSCSEYAEQAVRELGALRGSLFAAWRLLRCSPVSAGGVDRPPSGRPLYDNDIHSKDQPGAASPAERAEA